MQKKFYDNNNSNFRSRRHDKNNESSLLNERIKFRTLQVIDPNGEMHANMDTRDALKLAESYNLDLYIIAVQEKKVIAKILDYGKYQFELKRKQKENKKNQSAGKLKEIKVKPLIGDHDLKVRAENAKKWLASGDKVKFIIEARGRMSTKVDLIDVVYEKFVSMLEEQGNIIQAKKRVNDFRYETLIDPK